MPIDKSKYPENWREISKNIRARGICEFCGAANYQPHPITGSQVILTVAHMNHVPMDCAPENLKALCQRCHLAYDREQHARTRREKRNIGQLILISC